MNTNVEQMETETYEVKELTEEQVANLIKEILNNKEKFSSEARLILTLRFERRRGCGYIYDFDYDFSVSVGEADIVTLQRNEFSDCSIEEKIAVIPRTVPVVLITTEWDESPNGKNVLSVHLFDGSEWKATSIKLPYPLKYLSNSIFDR
ncbi:MAG: hypothetical protein JHC26_01950 [Thermofilum sp.]|jgi:hypothetical protein|uniref:hypothetical protein n=1 Tax=Thermofilum sp. TaxID=1961369 RepID=UPI0025889E04|nr:hypothetical protein [Thermofilum sp.]MCI4407826.1 hypothetical protein [Thermofilum sp.]